MTDTRRESNLVFNLVFCPDDPNSKVKELVSRMAHSDKDFVGLIMGPYRYDAHVELSQLDRRQGSLVALVKIVAHPDLFRHYVFIDVKASDVATSKTAY